MGFISEYSLKNCEILSPSAISREDHVKLWWWWQWWLQQLLLLFQKKYCFTVCTSCRV